MAEYRETFETYPFNPDAPNPVAPQDPIPSHLQPRATPPPPPPPSPPGFGRRVVLGFVASAGVLVAVGGVISAASRQSEPEPETSSWEPPLDEDLDEDEPVDETTFAVLTMRDYGEIGVEAPAGWQVDSQGDYLMISHDNGRLAARIPEWSRVTRSDLSKEADYLRDGFDPSGAPTVFDESTTSLTQFHQVAEGHLAGEVATEEVMLVLDEDRQLALAIWWATVDADKQATVQARTMAAELRAGFLAE